MIFCKARKRVIPTLLVFILTVSHLATAPDEQQLDIHDFVSRMKNALEDQDFRSYLGCFAPEIRDAERQRIDQKFKDFRMDSASVYLPSVQKQDEDKATVILRVFFENPSRVLIESWRLAVLRTDAGWRINNFSMAGAAKSLYKVSIPSDRAVRVKKFEVVHDDIIVVFEDAFCFYDNIPEMETAMIVVGKGQMDFVPSHPREKHQLELTFGKEFLRDKLSYVYLRFSDHFFQKSIKITEYENHSLPVSRPDINRAYSLFAKHYARSFTVQNSLNGELLSFLPQGDEVVIEFQGKKLGDASYIYSPFAEDEINLYQWKKERILNLYSPGLEEGQRRMFLSMSQKFDIKDYEIDLNFSPNRHYFSGTAKIAVKAKVGPLDGLKLKLDPNFRILWIRDGNQRNLYYTQDKLRKIVYIYFLNRPSERQTSTVEIFYRGRVEPPAQSADVSRFFQGTVSRGLYPVQFETFLYSGSSYWYPSPSDVDYFTARLKIRIPSNYQIVSCGMLKEHSTQKVSEDKSEEEGGEYSIYVFETNRPVKYLSFIAGKLELVEQESEDIPVQVFKSYYSGTDRWEVFAVAKNILQFYQRIFGPYPYDKLHIVKRAWDTKGGHSPASFIVLNDFPRMTRRRVREEIDSPVNLSRWKEYFLAHELAHQWWGQAIGWKSYNDQWLSEGMAQFGTILFLREKYGEKAFSQILKNFSKDINKMSKWGGITMGSRISYHGFDAYQTIVYNKTSLVLNMLKDLLGDEVFFFAVRKFFEQHKYSAVRSGSFFRAMQDVAGMDLQRFFDRWFNSHLLPDVRVLYTVHSDPAGFRLVVKILQVGDQFVFPLWIEWLEGEEKVRQKVLVESRVTNVEFELKNEPSKIKINPDKSVPGRFKVT